MLDKLLRQRIGSLTDSPASPDLSPVEVYRLYSSLCHPIDFVERRPLFCRFRDEFAWAARFSAAERNQVLYAVVSQAVDYGLSYVMAKVSPEAVAFRRWASQVTRELCKARGLIRLVPAEKERLLVGRWHFRSFLVDVVLHHLQRRYPHHQVVVVDEPWAYWLEAGALRKVEAGTYLHYLKDDAFAPYWETFYDSQNIAEQPRRTLAIRHLPKKYWSLVPEGAKIDGAGKPMRQEPVAVQKRLL